MRKFRAWVPIVLLCAAMAGCITIDVFPGRGPLREFTVSGEGPDKILLVELSGLLSTKSPSRWLNEPSLLERVKAELTLAEEDPRIKALILRINSPGGTVTASDILYHEFREFRNKRNIPIVAVIMDLGTSGGYYVAMAADKVVAHPSSVTGSLGVMMVTLNAQGLLEKVGIEPTTIVSGPKKAMGSPFRALTEEERRIFQGLIDSFHARFIQVIDESRPNLNSEDIRRLADGRIMTAQQAHEAGLIDRIGYMDDAIALAKAQAGLTRATVVTYRRSRQKSANIYSSFDSAPISLTPVPRFDTMELMHLLSGGAPQFMYVWLP
ncbi:MAG: signal peptide peptidase SppA [Nitrospirae bacterium]|nr:MAG: signal peptide peptidase SppA [Nitrospirota bacterium]